MMTHVNNIRGTRLIDVPHLPVEQAIKLLMQKSVWVREAVVKHCYRQISLQKQGESVNILLNFTQFFETRIEYRFQIFTAHSCDFLLPSYARLA